jgi:hypothetical protein
MRVNRAMTTDSSTAQEGTLEKLGSIFHKSEFDLILKERWRGTILMNSRLSGDFNPGEFP